MSGGSEMFGFPQAIKGMGRGAKSLATRPIIRPFIPLISYSGCPGNTRMERRSSYASYRPPNPNLRTPSFPTTHTTLPQPLRKCSPQRRLPRHISHYKPCQAAQTLSASYPRDLGRANHHWPCTPADTDNTYFPISWRLRFHQVEHQHKKR